jgi:hypothetical protein
MARFDKSDKAPGQAAGFFADLRRRNEYAARVARLLKGRRKHHVEHVVHFQRKHRVHQPR